MKTPNKNHGRVSLVPFYMDNVADFTLTIQQLVPIPCIEKATIEDKELRVKLIDEEWKEYRSAQNDLDKLDALCDLMYVVVGTAITFTVKLSKTYYSNMPHHPNELDKALSHLIDELEAPFPCQKRLSALINSAIITIESVANHHDFDLFPDAFAAVHNNNMDKLWRILPDGGIHPTYKITKVGQDLHLVKNEAGKVIKPPGHTKVDLTPFLPTVV